MDIKDIWSNGPIGKDKNGIDIYNRDFSTLKAKLFPELGNAEYLHFPAGNLAGREYVNLKMPPCSFNDFFQPGKVVVELGCGGGAAAIGMATEFPETQIIAVDHEMGGMISTPVHQLPNLTFLRMDWDNLQSPDNYSDGIISFKGIGDYGGLIAAKELTRIAKMNAMFRGTMNRSKENSRMFRDHLCKLGWEIWVLGPELMIAQKKIA